MRLNIRLRDNSIQQVEGELISIPGFPDFRFFWHRDPFGCPVISELSCGMRLVTGTKRGAVDVVVDAVQQRLGALGPAVFQQKVKAAQLEFGIANEVPA